MLRLLIFQVGPHDCALPAEAVREILHMAELTRLPGQPSVLEGFLNLRGVAIPVVRLHRLFDLPDLEPGLYTPLIVLRDSAYLVDSVLEVAGVSEEGLLPVQEAETLNGCATHQAAVDARTVQVLAPDRLLFERERRSLAEFQARAQRYFAELESLQP